MSTSSTAFSPVDPVFISYRQKDGTNITTELAWLLRATGVPVWRDRDDLPPGDTDARLRQAIDAGISSGVLVITDDVIASRVIKTVEAPRLLSLHKAHESFALCIVNAVRTPGNHIDYSAPDRVLELPPGTLNGVDQRRADRTGLLGLIKGLVWHRIASQRDAIEKASNTLQLSLQTRNIPQVYDRTGDDLDIRIRPSTHERLPSKEGLQDLKDTLGLLPDAATRAAASRIRVRGGAHLSVAFAVGAALPSTRIGQMEVLDNEGAVWASASTAQIFAQQLIGMVAEEASSSPTTAGRPSVAVYVDLLHHRSDAAFDRYLEQNALSLTAWRHLRPVTEGPLDPASAGAIAAQVADQLRSISNTNSNAEIHLLLRCPFPIALLIARLTNTLRFVLYEWDDSQPAGEPDHRPRYVPALRVRASAATGAIEEVLLP